MSSHVSAPRSGATSTIGSREQFGHMVSTHVAHMRRVATRVITCPDLAEDSVQDALYRVWRNGWLGADPRGALCSLAIRSARQASRAARRRCRHETCAALSTPECVYADDPATQAEHAEQLVALRDAIAGLPACYRSVLERHLTTGLNYESLALDLGIAVGTVRSRLHRARALLRARLGAPARDARARSAGAARL